MSPITATLLAVLSGSLAGMITGILHVKFKITSLLSGILVMGMLYSVNLRIMGKSNIPLFSFNHLFNSTESPILLALVFMIICKLFLDLFLKTSIGYTLKGVGDNSQMIKSLGIDIGYIKILGLMISNGLIALAGGLMAQFQGFTDVNMGTGTLVLGIASIIIGLTLFKKIKFVNNTSAIVVGAFIYQFTIYYAMQRGMLPTDLKLITALVIVAFLSISNIKFPKKNKDKEKAVA